MSWIRGISTKAQRLSTSPIISSLSHYSSFAQAIWPLSNSISSLDYFCIWSPSMEVFYIIHYVSMTKCICWCDYRTCYQTKCCTALGNHLEWADWIIVEISHSRNKAAGANLHEVFSLTSSILHCLLIFSHPHHTFPLYLLQTFVE